MISTKKYLFQLYYKQNETSLPIFDESHIKDISCNWRIYEQNLYKIKFLDNLQN